MAWDDPYNNPLASFFSQPRFGAGSGFNDLTRHIAGIGLGPIGIGYNLFNDLQGVTQDRLNGNALPDPTFQPPSSGHIGGIMGDDYSSGGMSTTDQILQQLMALQDPSKYLADDASLRAQAAAQAGAQYDPVIAALRNQATAASKRGNQNSATVKQMFSDLSDRTAQELPQIQNQYQGTMDKSANQYNQLKQDINAQYDNSQKQQEDMYNRLNIQAAASDVIPQQQADRNFYTNRASTDAQTQQSALTTERQGAVDYTNMGSQADRNEGVQRSADILSQLQDLLNQYDSQIGANEAAKSQASNSLYMQLQNQNKSSAADMAQKQFQNYIAATNLGRNLSNDEFSHMMALQGKQSTGVKSLGDVAPYALQMGLPETSAQNIQNVFSQTLMTDPSILAGVNADTGQALPAEAKAQRMLEAGRAAGLSQAELNALQDMALQYFGRG
jgi:hypothetical protein